MHINSEVTHEHTHEHTHADGVTHTHPHQHSHDELGHVHGSGEGHTHTHDGSTHTHGHDHVHTGAEAQPGAEQTKALLTYMLHHNEHHAEELAGMMDSLPEAAREKLSLAIGTFEAANVQLKEVLDLL